MPQPLQPADLDGALALVVEAGWNQVAADWQLFNELGAAFAIHDAAGRVIATAATLPVTGFGWISMVLVARDHRRQGLATRLLEHCIAQLRRRGLVPVLDATPAGRTVYQPLGFRDGWAITRWRLSAPARATPPQADAGVTVRPFDENDWREVDALDAQAFGSPRAAVLRRLHVRSRAFACVAVRDGRIAGFLLGRDGRQATQVGPVVARDPHAAAALLAHALERVQAPVLVDALDCHESLREQLLHAGFAVERGYTRMALDASRSFGDAGLMMAIAGPELG
jgi:GNAT superfamily N-acetyltransferase